MYLLNTSYKTKESIQYFTFIRIFKTQVWKELFNIFCVWMWLEGSEKPSIHSQPRYGDWLSTKEIKMSQKDINWKIIGAQDVLATKIKSYQKPVSVVILWLGHEIKILFSFFQISRPDYKI